MAILHAKTAILQNAVAASGNGVSFDLSGMQNFSVQVLGTFVGTVFFEGSNDGGTTWAAVPFFNSAGTNASSATAPGLFVSYFSGYLLLRARVAWTSGTSVSVYVGANG